MSEPTENQARCKHFFLKSCEYDDFKEFICDVYLEDVEEFKSLFDRFEEWQNKTELKNP
jgi:hypothetical protein